MLNTYNLTMLTDFYEITMANGYFHSDIRDQEACFDVFFRRVPDGGGFAIMAGLEQIIAYMKGLSFTEAIRTPYRLPSAAIYFPAPR